MTTGTGNRHWRQALMTVIDDRHQTGNPQFSTTQPQPQAQVTCWPLGAVCNRARDSDIAHTRILSRGLARESQVAMSVQPQAAAVTERRITSTRAIAASCSAAAAAAALLLCCCAAATTLHDCNRPVQSLGTRLADCPVDSPHSVPWRCSPLQTSVRGVKS